jgi:phosphopantothenoylcysteine decarboxylase / phosphopantothenate---cysteine ligase
VRSTLFFFYLDADLRRHDGRCAMKSILLIISGGIAAYKTLHLIRLLRRKGYGVRVILTKSAKEFVTPLTVASLSNDKVYDELFNLTDEHEMGHIALSRSADLVVVAPATANLIAKMVHGITDDIATTALLATDKPVMIAPAMNVRMWHHPATQRNIAQLKADGVTIIDPVEGTMACGEFGIGRVAEPEDIFAAIEQALTPQILKGKRVLVTSGPTREAIDPVRYISNHSSGKQGHAIAAACRKAGAIVTLVTGPVSIPTPKDAIHVETALQMYDAVHKAGVQDVYICAAAVADWRVTNPGMQKTKKKGVMPVLQFTENPDILASLKGKAPLVIGFAAETENVIENAQAKLIKKGCDMIIANDVSPATGTFGGDVNSVHIVTFDKVETWEKMSKELVAEKLVGLLV